MKYVLMFTSRPDLNAAVDPELGQAVYKKVYEWFVENGDKFADSGAELLGIETATTVKHGDDGPVVVDGPFNEAKEVVGGFAIFDAPSKAEMLKWTTRFMDLHKKHLPGWEGECEVRQIAGPGEKLCDQAREAQAAAV